MNFLKVLRKGLKKTHNNQKSIFNYNIDRQKKYLSKFEQPKDDFERSFFQYKCQVKIIGLPMELLLNIFSFFGAAYYLLEIGYVATRKKGLSENSTGTFEAIFISNDMPTNILPKKLEERYKEIKFEKSESSYILSMKDIKFILSLVKRYPFSWHFILKCLIKVSMYSSMINSYKPKALIAYTEFSFTSSVLTKYCEENDVQHINIMHGQKLYYIRDSFFRFHECYVWDENFKDLFIKLRAEPNQFIIGLPESIRIKNLDHVKKEFYATYYLAAESRVELEKIEISLDVLRKKGHRISIRPHPRYTDSSMVKEIFSLFEIEEFKEISIEESLARTIHAISLYSTVLYQASKNGVCPIVDDLTNPQKYKKLHELQYDILSKEHFLLSSFL